MRLKLLSVGLAAALLYPGAAYSQDANAGDPELGRTLYVDYGCYQCHGYEAQGGNAGKRLAPGPLPLAFITAYVRHPTGQMPPYTEKVITEKELADIYSFLLSIETPPAVDSISILND